MATPITICGNLTGAPELRFTPSGTAVANLNIAVNHRRKNPQTQEWEDAGTDFYGVAVWQKQGAENVAQSLDKGMEVIVTGRLKSRTYETKEGDKRTVWEIDADHVGPSLRRQEAQVRKVTPPAGGQGGHGWGQQPQQPQQGQPQGWGQLQGQPQGGVDPWAGQLPDDQPPF